MLAVRRVAFLDQPWRIERIMHQILGSAFYKYNCICPDQKPRYDIILFVGDA